MFDSGFLEMMVVAIIALLVVGPERLPGIARKVGGFIGKARAFVNTTKSDIEKELKAEELKAMLTRQEREISDLRDMMQDAKQDITKEVQELDETLTENLNTSSDSSSDDTDLITDSDDSKKA